MFLIDHYIAPSSIHGLGVFAAEPAAKGQLIWQFSPYIDLIIPETALPTLPPHVARRILKRSEYRRDVGQFVLGADGDSFMNHSDDPNFFDASEYTAIAGRDITVGDEITCDYNRSRVLMGFASPGRNRPPVKANAGT